jgi:hypothetical protein
VHPVHLDPSIAPLYLLRYSTAELPFSLLTFRANPTIVHVGHYGQLTVTCMHDFTHQQTTHDDYEVDQEDEYYRDELAIGWMIV